jgi:hypothetical protein
LKGISYDVGTLFGATPSRVSWHLADARRDLSVLRDELHCTTVNLLGTDLRRGWPRQRGSPARTAWASGYSRV